MKLFAWMVVYIPLFRAGVIRFSKWYYNRLIRGDVEAAADICYMQGLIDADEHARMVEAEEIPDFIWTLNRLQRVQKGLY